MAVDNSTQREIKLLCLHEVGWCYLIKLDFVEGNTTFTLLKQRSRWSRSFYAYLALICAGACNILTEFTDIVDLQNILSNSNQKTSQLDVYLNRRVKIFPENEIELQKCDVSYWKMFTYELLYLWNALPSCSQGNLENILDGMFHTQTDIKIDCQYGINSISSLYRILVCVLHDISVYSIQLILFSNMF